MKPLNWKAAIAGSALVGIGVGGFAVAGDDTTFPAIDPVGVRLSDLSAQRLSAPVAIAVPGPKTPKDSGSSPDATLVTVAPTVPATVLPTTVAPAPPPTAPVADSPAPALAPAPEPAPAPPAPAIASADSPAPPPAPASDSASGSAGSAGSGGSGGSGGS